ncbi:MAG: YtxH domain-containing protein [Ignavibacteria bacterium]|nr:YtxH domain-containing protein [Ignavibacteria bacterium]MBI3766068.1 YtxH domain-containing protein [Ignavibacteriales bacterium]
MAEEKNGMAKGLLIGFLAGSVIGAITALLYAPKSGKELRSDLKKKADDIATEAADYVKATREKTLDLVNQGKNRSEQLVTEAKEKAGHILDDAEKVLTGIRERTGSEAGRVKSAFRAGMDAYKNDKNQNTA